MSATPNCFPLATSLRQQTVGSRSFTVDWTENARRAFAWCKGVGLGIASLLRHRKRVQFAPGLPHLVHVQVQGDFSAKHLAQVGSILAGFTPAVDPGSPGSFRLNFFGSPLLNADWAATLCRLQLEILKFTGMNTRIGAGRSQVLAELACSCKSDAGVNIVAAGSEKSFLEKLSIEMLTAGRNLRGVDLRHRGIVTIGELSRIPRPVLRAAFGFSVGDGLWLNSRGVDGRPSVA